MRVYYNYTIIQFEYIINKTAFKLVNVQKYYSFVYYLYIINSVYYYYYFFAFVNVITL